MIINYKNINYNIIKKLLFVVIFTSISIHCVSQSFPWGRRIVPVQTQQYISKDINTTYLVAVEWGVEEWVDVSFGYGISTDNTDDWIWEQLVEFGNTDSSIFFVDTVSVSNPGKYYYAFRINNPASGISYSFGDEDWLQNLPSISPVSWSIIGEVTSGVGDDWFSEDTWEGNRVPVDTSHVAIMHNVTIASEAAEADTVYVYDSNVLTVNSILNSANVVNNGTVTLNATLNSDTVTINGILTLNADLNSGNVVINGDVDVEDGNHMDVGNKLKVQNSGTLTIKPGGKVTVDGTTENYGSFTIESASTKTGSFIPIGSITETNAIVVQRYIGAWGDANHGWHFLSSPVTGQAISTEFVDITATPIVSTVDLYKWGEPLDLWINIRDGDGSYNQGSASTNWSNDASPTFEVGKGYLIAYQSNQDKSFSGTLNNADVPKSGLTYTESSTHTGWNLLGNPYQSAVFWNKTAWGLINVDATAKIWVESIASYTDIDAITGIIPAMQGFMVRVSTASTGSLTIKAADRTHSETNWYKDTEVNKIKLTVYDTEGSTAQESIIKFNENATASYDVEYDSYFLAGYAPMFYSSTVAGALSTNALPEVTDETTIPMSFIKNTSSTYYIEAEGVNNLVPQETVYLTDLKTNYTQILNDNPVYNFTSEEGDVSERFIIHFGPLGVEEIKLSQHIKIFAAYGKIELRSKKPFDAKINISTISGQLISTSHLNNESSVSVPVHNYKGVAIVTIITSGQILTKKVIVW